VSEGAPFTVSYVITDRSPVEAQQLAASNAYRLYLVLLLFLAVLGLYAWTIDSRIGAVAIGAALVLAALSRTGVLGRYMIRRRAKNVLGGTTTLVFDHDGIRATTPLWSGIVGWSGLTEVRSNDRVVVFLSGQILSAYAPVPSFGSPARVAAVIAYARARIAATRPSAAPPSG
jgi:hypothetical protein